jgi:hypothetical protein
MAAGKSEDVEHSLVHDVTIADCKTPWESMEKTEFGRRCCRCGSEAFQIEELNRIQDRASLPASTGDQKLMRKFDGSYVFGTTDCGLVPARFRSSYRISLIGSAILIFLTANYAISFTQGAAGILSAALPWILTGILVVRSSRTRLLRNKRFFLLVLPSVVMPLLIIVYAFFVFLRDYGWSSISLNLGF